MKFNKNIERKIQDAWFTAGFGLKGSAKINKTTTLTMELQKGGNIMAPGIVCIFRKNKKVIKRLVSFSLSECLAAIRKL